MALFAVIDVDIIAEKIVQEAVERDGDNMATLSKLKVGQILHDYHRHQMGNTEMSVEGHWTLVVLEIDLEHGKALCSWNGNSPRWYYEMSLKKFREKEKVAK